MLRSMSYALSVRKLFVTGPLLSRLQPRQSYTPSLFIYGRHPTDFQIATLTRSPVNFKYTDPKERDPCPLPPPTPPPPPKDDKMLWGTIALIFLTGGFVVYAKGSPEIRDWLTLHAPWLDDFIAIMYQENMTYGEFAEACINDTKKLIDQFTGKNKPKKCSTDGAPVEGSPPGEKPRKKGESICGTGRVCDKKPEEKKPKEVKDEEDEDNLICEKPIPPVLTQNICDIEKCMAELSDCAMNNYFTAREACASYNSCGSVLLPLCKSVLLLIWDFAIPGFCLYVLLLQREKC